MSKTFQRPSPARSRRLRFVLSLVLGLAALPAMAEPVLGASMGNDSADAEAPIGRRVVTDSMGLTDRTLLSSGLGRATAADAKPAKVETGIKGVLQRALALLGTPYRWGGTSPDSGFDCSGLVGYVFRNALGIELPRVSRDMAKSGQLISDRSALAEGDLVFFGRSGQVDHVGIYLGDGRFVHAPRTGRDVTVSSLETGYWAQKFMQARRVQGS